MLAMIMELEDCREDLVLGATNFFFWMCVGELGTAAFAERLADTYSREKAKAIEADPAMATGEDSKFDDFKIEHALNTACEHGNIGVAKYLLEYLKSMRPLEQYYKGRLTVAGEVRNKEIFRLVLSSFNIDVNDPSPGFDLGFVLYHAAACGCEDVVAALLANPACGPSQINSLHQNYSFMGTPLSAASDVEVIKMLLDSKADVNPVGGVSVFAASAESYHIEAVRLLCEAGASAAYGDVAERQGYTLTETVLSAASCGGNSESHQTVIKLLLKAGLRTRGLSKGSTALTACCTRFNHDPVPLMRALLAHDPGLLEATDGNGETPLVVASRRSSPSGKLFLLRAGADPAACDSDGRTALHMLWDSYIWC
jgi:ankyrin repeat protein